ncbi:hypothetical protein Taro_031152 [Colocasia esculenta]|uniref:Remorin C-terminal domain-containing protein n=1 Tax=Colocasia esculenta TaxID=4460 RepID=A0A843VR42_COLES|nr:hypothetical protein [Colocasia esculenta]
MAEAEAKAVDVPASSEETAPTPPVEATKDVTEEKVVIPPAPEEKPDVENAVLERVETEKRLSLVKAWEENEKTKIENKSLKQLSAVNSWENTKKATVEEALEKKKAEYAEKLKNKVATIHKVAEEKRALVEAKKGEDLLKAEELASKYRIKGLTPKKVLGCFGN